MQPLRGLDAFFLYAENDTMHLHVALTAVLDPTNLPDGLPFERIAEHIEQRVHLVPPFTRKLVQAPGNLHHPVWIEDPDFRIERHLRRVTLPQPGGPEDLGRMCGAIASVPLDRAHPLWQMWVIDGLYDGNVALVAKIHHACVDGVSGVEIMTTFFDLDSDAPPPTPPGPRVVDTNVSPTDDLLGEAVRERVRATRQLAPLARDTLRRLSEVRGRRRDQGESGGTPLTAPRTRLNGRLTAKRNVAFAHVDLAQVKEVKDALEVTVNDVVLGLCTGALRRYLDRHGEVPDRPLVASVPVSIRTDEQQGEHGNRVSFLITQLRTDVEHPVEQVLATRDVTRAAKHEHQILGPSALSDWADVADPLLMRLGAQLYLRSGLTGLHPPIHNLVVSNVPGPPFPVYLAGAQLVRAYPLGPVMEGAGLNVTVMSYLDSLDIGFMVCDDVVPDVWDLADAVRPAFDELRRAALGPDAAAHPSTAASDAPSGAVPAAG